MSRVALGLVLAGMAAMLPTMAAATPVHANAVSWAPAEVWAGEPVSVVLKLYVAGPNPALPDGPPARGPKDVGVVIRGNGQERRFATMDLGGGRYASEITFPAVGGWHVRVAYRRGRRGTTDEIPLGKGGIYVGRLAAGGSNRAVTPPPAAPVVGAAMLLLAGAALFRPVSARVRAAFHCLSRDSPDRPG